jgi:hypothetical protein
LLDEIDTAAASASRLRLFRVTRATTRSCQGVRAGPKSPAPSDLGPAVLHLRSGAPPPAMICNHDRLVDILTGAHLWIPASGHLSLSPRLHTPPSSPKYGSCCSVHAHLWPRCFPLPPRHPPLITCFMYAGSFPRTLVAPHHGHGASPDPAPAIRTESDPSQGKRPPVMDLASAPRAAKCRSHRTGQEISTVLPSEMMVYCLF